MCRLFGFRSVITSQVHSSLIHAENALMDQSKKHPDGWGIAYYIEKNPHLIRSALSAIDDHLFEKISGVVSSQTVLAHIRNGTQGINNILNTHPFQYGPWVFAHNGNIKNLDGIKDKLIAKISPRLKRFILGNTDSEIIFYVILSYLEKDIPLDKREILFDEILNPIKEALLFITSLTGPLLDYNETIPTENYLSFILTNGSLFLGFQGGQSLKYCTHKTQCPERDNCPHFAHSCENPSKDKENINHLILTSEEIKGVNVWSELAPGELVGVDHNMNLRLEKLPIQFEKRIKK
tara:strand:- start:164853 stop:165731 length:879 start_codon:yes stop_codon:yes gene_type:complete